MNPTQNFLKRTFKNISGSCLKANSGPQPIPVPISHKEALKAVSVAEIMQSQKKKSQTQALKERFLNQWRQAGGPPLECEFKFFEDRRWRFDFVHKPSCVAIEVDGGVFVNGGHNRGAQITKDYEKRNAAIVLHWKVFQLTTKSIQEGEEIPKIVKFIADGA